MRTIKGTSFSGDWSKIAVDLQLSGMQPNGHYFINDRAEGKISLRSKQDMRVQRVVVELHFVLDSKDKTSSFRIDYQVLSKAKFLTGGTPEVFRFKLSHRFHRPSFHCKSVASSWQLKVLVDYDTSQFKEDFVKRMVNRFSSEKPYGVAFTFPVQYGKGVYRAFGRPLPIGAQTEKNRARNFMGVGAIFLLMLLFLDVEKSNWHNIQIGVVVGLVLLAGLAYAQLNLFQNTPMELLSLKDGQLRLRMLDRGKQHLAKAKIGYRVKSYYVVDDSNYYQHHYNTKLLERSFTFTEVAKQQDHFHELTLPLPKEGLPTSYATHRAGYTWELFLKVPSWVPLLQNELTWPITVDWEPLRIPGTVVVPGADTETLEFPNRAPLKELLRNHR